MTWCGSPGTKCKACGGSVCSERRHDTYAEYSCELCGEGWQTMLKPFASTTITLPPVLTLPSLYFDEGEQMAGNMARPWTVESFSYWPNIHDDAPTYHFVPKPYSGLEAWLDRPDVFFGVDRSGPATSLAGCKPMTRADMEAAIIDVVMRATCSFNACGACGKELDQDLYCAACATGCVCGGEVDVDCVCCGE